MNKGCLYIIATPIGNREDITFRAIKILRSVDLLAAEDTRHSKKLLEYYKIKTTLFSLHKYNESKRTALLCEKLNQGFHIALIADAGTPLISDPGYQLVNTARKMGIDVVPVPGACAAIAALVASGLPTHQFIFEGFLSSKKGVRRKKLESLKNQRRTIIFYESVHRIVDLIHLLNEIFENDRRATIARELTKKFEIIYTATLAELKNWINKSSTQKKGEFVVIVAGQVEKSIEVKKEHQLWLTILLSELPFKQAISLATKMTGLPKKNLYTLALNIYQHIPPLSPQHY